MQFKKYTKQRNRSIQGLRSFKDTLPKNIKKVINKKGHIYSETLSNWKYIVGNDLFKICYPKSFKSENKVRGSLLEIMVKRGHEVDMEYSKKQVVDKVNNFFNENVLNNIKLITFEGYNKKFQVKTKKKATISEYTKKISDIKNDKIKNSLLELSKLYKQR